MIPSDDFDYCEDPSIFCNLRATHIVTIDREWNGVQEVSYFVCAEHAAAFEKEWKELGRKITVQPL